LSCPSAGHGFPGTTTIENRRATITGAALFDLPLEWPGQAFQRPQWP
jgi:hypothetical protein